MKIRLRYLLTAAFTLVAVVPLMFLGFWVERTALNNEIDAVREKHLLLADYTATLLERYAYDVETVFDYFTSMKNDAAADESLRPIASHFAIRHLCIIDPAGTVIRDLPIDPDAAPAFNKAILARLMPLLYNRTAYSPVMPGPAGEPTIYLIRRVAKDRIALAALQTDYLVQLQAAITFGDRGHAAIVDQKGNVIAHPNDRWRRTMKNIAGLEPVTHMLAKERGVATFHSPTVRLEMIAGYTTVAQTGWGVMVPQPMDELVAKANGVKRVALIIAAVGIVAAAFLSWIFAKRLTKPIEAVQLTAQRIAAGKLNSRVPPLPRLASSDLSELAEDFNKMASRIQSDQKMLASALGRAQSADRAKTRFLANMSHELRTPLNAIIGFSETIENQLLGPIGNRRYADYAGDIRQSGQHLLSVINYILDLSKIEGEDITVENDTVNVVTLVRSVYSMLQQDAEAGDVTLSIDIRDHLPRIRGSEVKLKQVLLNLVSNAVKYTPAGGAVVIGARQEEGGGIAISVRDSGIGMSKADQTMALTPFGRVENEMSTRVSGTGLGLPLAKRFIEVHGGHIEIESARGDGTTVTAHLPAARTIADVA